MKKINNDNNYKILKDFSEQNNINPIDLYNELSKLKDNNLLKNTFEKMEKYLKITKAQDGLMTILPEIFLSTYENNVNHNVPFSIANGVLYGLDEFFKRKIHNRKIKNNINNNKLFNNNNYTPIYQDGGIIDFDEFLRENNPMLYDEFFKNEKNREPINYVETDNTDDIEDELQNYIDYYNSTTDDNDLNINEYKGHLTDKVSENFSNKIANLETGGSKNPYSETNSKSSATGKYQFLKEWFPKMSKYFGYEINEKILKENPELQEDFFKNYYYPEILVKESKKLGKYNNSNLNEEQLKALIHRVGYSNAKKYLSGASLPSYVTKKEIDAYIKDFKNGGIIKNNLGQWKYPGEITEINSQNITMENVNYPVLGFDDNGEVKMMFPDNNYKFSNNKVTEIPTVNYEDILDSSNILNKEIKSKIVKLKNGKYLTIKTI